MAYAQPDQEAQIEARKQLAQQLGSYWDDPLGFVLFAWPWLKPGTPLENETGPDKWQRKALTKIGRQIKQGEAPQKIFNRIRLAVRSGHGVGKTALVAWVIHWFMTTRPDPQVVVTASTQSQLTTKTWRELEKWRALAINGDWFEHTATSYKHKQAPKTWFATAQPWSEGNSEAFAGTHEKFLLYVFDEASGIADVIWEVSEGAMTTPGAAWIVFGNPTKSSGRFSQCWGKFRKRWATMEVDSREAKKADIKQLEEWIEDYGIDSDFVRVRVLGKPPKSGPTQFIPTPFIQAAIKRSIPRTHIHSSTPRVAMWDVAREGDDMSVGGCRYGPKLIPESIEKYRDLADLMKLSGFVAAHAKKWRPDVIFIDATGMGAGVYDRMVQLGYDNVVPVYAGEKAMRSKVYYNLRAEMWGRMREWLKTADIPDDVQLETDLEGPEYYYDDKMRIRLEKKSDMKKRGLASPDMADMLALGFAQIVPERTGHNSDSLEPEEV